MDMKFTLLLEELLNEASPIEIYNKYYSDIKPAAFLKIVSADPQTELNPGRNTKIEERVKRLGKWAKLLLSIYKKGGLKFEDLDRAKDYLSIIYTRKVAKVRVIWVLTQNGVQRGDHIQQIKVIKIEIIIFLVIILKVLYTF